MEEQIIQYSNTEKFVWNENSAGKELLEYILMDYSANEPEGVEMIPSRLRPKKMESENINIKGRKFARIKYGNILKAGFKKVLDIKLDEIHDLVNLKEKTISLLKKVDGNLTLKDLTDKKTTAIALGDTSNIVSLPEEAEKGFEGEKAVISYNAILEKVDVKTITKSKKEDAKTVGKQAKEEGIKNEYTVETIKSWSFDEDDLTINGMTIQDAKIETLEKIGYSQVNIRSPFNTKYALRRKLFTGSGGSSKGSFGQKQSDKKAESDLNPLEATSSNRNLKGKFGRRWLDLPSWEYENAKMEDEKKPTNFYGMKKVKSQIKLANNLLIILQELSEVEYESKELKEKNPKKTGNLELLIRSKKTLEGFKNLQKDMDSPEDKSKSEPIDLEKDAEQLYEYSEALAPLLEIDKKIDKWYGDDIDFDAKENKELDEIIKALRSIDVAIPKLIKEAIKLKSNEMLDKAFKQLNRNFNKKLNVAKSRYSHHLEQLENNLKEYIKNQSKKENKYERKKKEYTKEREEILPKKKTNTFKTKDKAGNIFNDMEKFAKEHYRDIINDLFSTHSYTIQVQETKSITEEYDEETGKHELVENNEYKVLTIEHRKLKSITVSKGLASGVGNKANQTQRLVKPMSPDNKRFLSIFFAKIQKRYRKIDRIIQ